MQKRKKQKWMRTLLVALVVLLLFSAVAFANQTDASRYRNLLKAVEAKQPAELSVPNGDAALASGFTDLQLAGYGAEKVAENDTLALFLDEDLQGIHLVDKRSNMVWSSSVPDSMGIRTDLPESAYKSMRAMLNFSYIDLSSDDPVEKQAWSTDDNCKASRETIRNGVRVTYVFQKLNIHLSVDIQMEDDRLSVSVPDSAIQENEQTGGAAVFQEKLSSTAKRILSACKSVQALTAKSDYSESKHKLIELTVTDVDKQLTEIQQEADAGIYTELKFENLDDDIDRLVTLVDDLPEAKETLKNLPGLSATVKATALQLIESSANGITSLQVMPYFGAQRYGTDGYAFYPDKNGAVSYFNILHASMSGSYQQDVYTQRALLQLAAPDAGATTDTDYRDPAHMPVYGVKAGKSAFVAVLDKGDADSAIVFNPCVTDKDISNITGVYDLRKKTTYVSQNGAQVEAYDSRRTAGDWRTCYMFLSGDDADYSGMAVRYRSYLEEKGLLVRSKRMDGALPLALSYYIGTQSDRQSLFREYIAMTRFSSIEGNLRALQEGGVQNILLNLTDWTAHSGKKEPNAWEPAAEAGGAAALQSLAAYAVQQGYLISLSNEVVWEKRTDLSAGLISAAAVKSKSQLTFESDGWHLLNPSLVFHLYQNEFLPVAKRFGVNSLTLESAGRVLYFDYNKLATYDRADTAAAYSQLGASVQNSLGAVTGMDANAYCMGTLDWDMDVDEQDNGFLYTDENVPFYQIVLHGSVLYTGTAFNLMEDRTGQELRAVEYGYIPCFSLTEQSPFLMRDAGYNNFFSGEAQKLLPEIERTYQTYSRDLGAVWNQRISEHVRLTEELRKTVYENGYAVYVNYGNKDQTVEGISVPAKGYAVKKP